MGPAVGYVIVEQSLSPEMLSPRIARGVRSFCPRFAVMSDADKRAFWAYTFQALAGAEAGLKPTTDVRHTEPEVADTGHGYQADGAQEGLLQLTYMDAKRYGCDFNWEQDKALPEKDPAKTILQPSNNLLCGVKILENQMITPEETAASPHRATGLLYGPRRPSYLVFAKQMTNVPAACRQGSASGRSKGRRSGRERPRTVALLRTPQQRLNNLVII